MRKHYLMIAALALLVTLPLAANAIAGDSRRAVVTVAKVGGLGQVIVDSKRMRLYDFHKDKGKISSCYGQCAEAWPPLLTNGSPKATGASALGTTKRKDGTTQVTYKGHPLYGFIEDKNQANPTATASTASAACGSRSIRTAQRPLAERSLWGKDL